MKILVKAIPSSIAVVLIILASSGLHDAIDVHFAGGSYTLFR